MLQRKNGVTLSEIVRNAHIYEMKSTYISTRACGVEGRRPPGSTQRGGTLWLCPRSGTDAAGVHRSGSHPPHLTLW
jgi:hypothetical protein